MPAIPSASNTLTPVVTGVNPSPAGGGGYASTSPPVQVQPAPTMPAAPSGGSGQVCKMVDPTTMCHRSCAQTAEDKHKLCREKIKEFKEALKSYGCGTVTCKLKKKKASCR